MFDNDLLKPQQFINGEWVEALGGGRLPVYNPATGELVAEAAYGGAADAELAVQAAHEAFPSWSARTASERSALLYRWYRLIMNHQEQLAAILNAEMGKPLQEARGEIRYGADYVLWYAEEAKRVYGNTVPASSQNKRIVVMRQPVGVAAAITPWNFPCAMVTRKMAPALASGCTVVVKPSELTPLTAIALFTLLERAGLPPGAANLVTGSPADIGDCWLQDDRVKKISFTGSTEVGKHLMRGSADQVKKLSLELGGHAPAIVFDDADIELAVKEIMKSKFRNSGQTCVCANRIYVQKGALEAFSSRFAEEVRALKACGGPGDGSEIGPLINDKAYAKVARHVEDALSGGARLLAGGKGDGRFFEPTVLAGVTHDMLVCREETFGPVAPIIAFESEEEAVRMANDTPYGLAAYVFTRELSRSIRMAEKLEYGIVGVNDGMPSTVQAPFGGMKQSGIGREGGYQGIEAYLETKMLSILF